MLHSPKYLKYLLCIVDTCCLILSILFGVQIMEGWKQLHAKKQRTATKITVEITGRIFYGTKESVYHDNDYIKPCPSDCRAAG